MTKELSDKLMDRWPQYFNRSTPPVRGGFWGFECGDGWFNLLENLLSTIELEGLDLGRVLQVKEKFGGLRFYVQSEIPDYARIQEIIAGAEVEASHTCEVCGAEGKARPNGWTKTLCDVHHAKREAERNSA